MQSAKRDTNLILYHGWASSDSFWQPLINRLQKFYNISVYNAGYFGKPVNPISNADSYYQFALTHSYGLHRALKLQNQFNGIISICGFPNLGPTNTFNSTMRKATQDMLKLFASNHAKALRKFYRLSALPIPQQNQINLDMLYHDLQSMLDNVNGPSIPLSMIISVKDKIIPYQTSFVSAQNLKAERIIAQNRCNHSLGYRYVAWCEYIIHQEIQRMKRNIARKLI